MAGGSIAELGMHVDDLDIEARCAQATGDVRGVEADVVVLEKRALAIIRGGDRGILVGRRAVERERDHDQAEAARRRDAAQLGDRCRVVGDVLEHVRADDGVEGAVREVERRDVELQVDAGRVDVGADVAQVRERLQTAAQAPFGRELQQRARVAQQLGAALEQQPLRAVALV